MLLKPLIDTFGRQHDYLRISLTDACNLRCTYCMPNEKMLVTPSAKLMQANEIFSIADTFIQAGIKKIRLTGGEPLLRKDAGKIIQLLSMLPVELAISTNAVLADQYLDVLKSAAVSSVNVSLDTLNPEEFFAITKRNDFDIILSNIYLLLSHGLKVKVNIVVMKGINEHTIPDFIEWTKKFPLEVRFIEFMPFKGNSWHYETVFSYEDMLQLISTKYEYRKLQDAENSTSKSYQARGHKGTFGFISTITAPFCDSCSRLRLTADGKMKNCLFDRNETDLLSALRRGDDIIQLIQESLQNKKKERGGLFESIADPTAFDENRTMISIGG